MISQILGPKLTATPTTLRLGKLISHRQSKRIITNFVRTTDDIRAAQQDNATPQWGEVYQYEDPYTRWEYDEWKIPHDGSDSVHTDYGK